MSITTQLPLKDVLDPDKIGSFIGRSGVNMKEIERRNKVILHLVKGSSGTSHHYAEITGLPDRVHLANVEVRELLLRILRESSCHTISIPSRMIGYLIGKNGRKISEIRNDTRVKIDIEPADGPMCTIRIYGTYTSVLAAVHMIKDRLDSFGKKITPHEMPDRKEFMESWTEVAEDN